MKGREAGRLTELRNAAGRDVVVQKAAASAKVALAEQPEEGANLAQARATSGRRRLDVCLFWPLSNRETHLSLVLRVPLDRPKLMLAMRVLRWRPAVSYCV